MTEPPVTFAGVLRRLRTGVQLTQEELARVAGLSVRAVSDLERGVATTPHRDTVRLLADALQLIGPVRAEFEAAARGPACRLRPRQEEWRRRPGRCPVMSPRSPAGMRSFGSLSMPRRARTAW